MCWVATEPHIHTNVNRSRPDTTVHLTFNRHVEMDPKSADEGRHSERSTLARGEALLPSREHGDGSASKTKAWGGATRTTTSTGIPTPSHGTLHAHTAAQHINTLSNAPIRALYYNAWRNSADANGTPAAAQLPRASLAQVLQRLQTLHLTCGSRARPSRPILSQSQITM
eukprot:CAMPEP_0181203370 /NCGR_PEP_ID=MMETSP1096-20121128/19347_1 /TAXON_ID=156174 ORGANISM="Chrysochromulina ericina, Strain CCMP281" /NCGR_SAMPLE_ID=MMETSP1096 /ASSEMBLY_ACC=CAM_ASM_000453 /LENGTH=169 /DNA_ID=CAMNT_0023293961 /DNA_START=782 /DNA_END=1291 /DNA_ORIENTATION=-